MKERYENISSEDVYWFASSGIRGAPAFSVKKISTANNEHVRNFNGNSKERTHLVFTDINSLYPGILWQYSLPFSGYQFMSKKELDETDFLNISESSDIGYIFQVTLECPPEIHDEWNMMPLAPHQAEVSFSEISENQRALFKQYENKISNPFKMKKLLMDFHPKQKYLVYFKTLKFYLIRGLKITKVHAGLKFKEKHCLRDFIGYCLNLRKEARLKGDEIAEYIIKLFLVSIYGKFLSNTKDATALYAQLKLKLCR